MGLKPRPDVMYEAAFRRYVLLVDGESPVRKADFGWTCVAKRYGQRRLLPARPASARECVTCRGRGEIDHPSAYRVAVPQLETQCGDCVGRGWRRNPFAERPNPLTELFRRAWCEPGFSAELVADPRGVLAQLGLEVSAKIDVRVAEDRQLNWCIYCQLTYARVELTPGRGEPTGAGSPLQQLFDRCWRDESPGATGRELLARANLEPPHNVVVERHDGARPRVELVVGHHRHVCTCDELDLRDLVHDR